MKATLAMLRRSPEKIIEAIERNESVTLTRGGKAVARIEPVAPRTRVDPADHRASAYGLTEKT